MLDAQALESIPTRNGAREIPRMSTSSWSAWHILYFESILHATVCAYIYVYVCVYVTLTKISSRFFKMRMNIN